MAEYLALDLDGEHLCGVLADVSESRIAISKTFAVSIPTDVADEIPLLGAWLGETLRKQGISARQALLCLPREEVSVRHLELPPVDESELPQMVRFQAATKSTVPLDQLALDYLLLPQRAGFAGRDVLSVTVPQERIGKVFGMALTAGLEVVSIGVSSVATAEIVIEAEQKFARGENDISLVVARHGGRIEISLVGQGCLYFSHSTQSDGRSDQSPSQVLAEASRAVVALSKRLPNARINHVWLLGGGLGSTTLATASRERFDCEVTQLDPFKADGIELRAAGNELPEAAFSGPIGLLLAHARHSNAAIDFINPRRPVVKKDYTAHKRWAVAAAAAVVVLSAYGYRAYAVSALKDDYARLQGDLKSDKEQNDKLQPQVNLTEKVDAWSATHMNWLDETQALAKKMQGTERLYLNKVDFSLGNVKGQRATISLAGNAKERGDWEGLSATLSAPDVDVLTDQKTKKSLDGDYADAFAFLVTMKKPDEKPGAKKTAK